MSNWKTIKESVDRINGPDDSLRVYVNDISVFCINKINSCGIGHLDISKDELMWIAEKLNS